MTQQVVAAFIDILGYKNMIMKHIDNKALIEDMKKVIIGSSTLLLSLIKSKAMNNESIEEYVKNILSTIKVRFISDSFLCTCHMSEISFSHQDYTKAETISHCLWAYFNYLKMFCTTFIGHTGLVLRGGIEVGKHYEDDVHHDGMSSLYIFSEAFIGAYGLENKAVAPRIIIGNGLWKLIDQYPIEDKEKSFYKDNDGFMCLDMYSLFRNENNSREILADVKKGIESNISVHKSDVEIMKKLKYAVELHNTRVRELKMDDLSIHI